MSQPPSFDTIAVTVNDQIATLEMCQPRQLNPLGTVPLAEIVAAARWLDTTEATVVVVRGQGRAFSSGFDLREFAASDGDDGNTSDLDPRDQGDLGRQMADAVEAMRAVTIAAISGACIGGGVVLAGACDLRIAATDTRFAIPEVDLGIPLAWGGIARLLRELPPAVVRELVLTCRPFDAHEAQSLGFVNRVVEPDDLDTAVADLATSLAAKAPSVLRMTKRQVNTALEGAYSTVGAWADADLLGVALRDPQARAAARDYLARRR